MRACSSCTRSSSWCVDLSRLTARAVLWVDGWMAYVPLGRAGQACPSVVYGTPEYPMVLPMPAPPTAPSLGPQPVRRAKASAAHEAARVFFTLSGVRRCTGGSASAHGVLLPRQCNGADVRRAGADVSANRRLRSAPCAPVRRRWREKFPSGANAGACSAHSPCRAHRGSGKRSSRGRTTPTYVPRA